MTSEKILIVDDTPEQLVALEHLLKKKGREFVKAGKGQEAIKIALTNQFSLIIIDIQMPDMDGFEVAEILQANSLTQNVPIILITAHHDAPDEILKGYTEGAVDYLIKPLDPAITRAKVDAFLKMYSNQKKPDETSQQVVDEDQIFVKSDSKFVKIKHNDILYIESAGDYALIHTPNQKIVVYSTMKKLESMFPQKQFIRVHRSYIVNANHIGSIQDYVLNINGTTIPIGRSYQQTVTQTLLKN